MNRTEKKCFIASAGVHLLLLLILLIGPAFLSRNETFDEAPILEFIPVITTYQKAQGGGDPTVKSLPAAQQERPPVPEPPKPAPAPERNREPDPVPEPVRRPAAKPEVEEKKDDDSLELNAKPKRPQVNLNLVKRPNNSKQASKAQAERESREAVERTRRLAQQLDQAVSGIKGGLSGSTEIRLKGPGGGGLPYANFFDAVRSVYARAWIVPDGVTDDSATAVAAVVIAKDGSVVSARITRSSGNAAVDRSVQATLDRVRYVAPLPASETASQREVSINFNVKAAKQLLG